METVLSREDKRKIKKKERKRKQRQFTAITKKDSHSEQSSDEKNDEKQKQQVNQTPLPKSQYLCSECNSITLYYRCDDCQKTYCKQCYESVHREIQRSGGNFHINVHDVEIKTNEPSREHDEERDRVDDLLKKSGFVRSRLEAVVIQEVPSTVGKKQHSGLRCKKCFELLVHDDEFLFAGGNLFTNPKLLKERKWNSLHHRDRIVYCKNMHNIGRVQRATYANQGITFYKITLEKVTWKENYLDNPEYTGSVIIQDKPVGTTRPLMPCEYDFSIY